MFRLAEFLQAQQEPADLNRVVLTSCSGGWLLLQAFVYPQRQFLAANVVNPGMLYQRQQLLKIINTWKCTSTLKKKT